MQNHFTDWPDSPWKQGWFFSSGPEDRTPFVSGSASGALTAPDSDWTLQLIEPAAPCTTRLFANGFSISARKHPDRNHIDAWVVEPGVLYGTFSGLPAPQVNSASEIKTGNGFIWTKNGSNLALLLIQDIRFALVYGELTPERALSKAEVVLEEDFSVLVRREAEERKNIQRLFSVNPRHNPPVALAAENLTARLRDRTPALHGLWSLAEGFPRETFSLNELYPLIRAWNLIDPPVALELVQTALSLQQSSGGFPAWVEAGGLSSPAAPWPFIAQSFEQVWQNSRDMALLKKYLPALRKYVQWASRRFDPHRDRIPAWQSEQEIFVPESFERGKATPELTVMLLAEIDAVLRLCQENENAEQPESLIEERNQLAQTLNTVFWNPGLKAFSNVWKDGHYLHQPSFGSFMPLFWRGLERDRQTALLESFEETHGFPGHLQPASWKQDEMDDTAHLPAIHQFMALEAIRNADSARGLLMLFVRRAREGFAAWFERESIEAARSETHGRPAYALGPITAALVLTTQAEFEHEAAKAPSAAQLILQWGHRLRIRKADLKIIAIFLLAILTVHLAYTIPHNRDTDARVAEAAMNYQQGRYTEALNICRKHPNSPLSSLLQANILMIADRPDLAESFYRQALTQQTESPSALFGLALALQMNGDFKQAEKRYGDFIDIYETRQPEASALAEEFMQLARDRFSKPPRWRRAYALPLMNDLGL